MKNHYKIDLVHYPHAIESEMHDSVMCPRHMHISPEIVMVTEGVLNMAIADNEYSIPCGTCAFIPPLIPHEFISRSENKCRVITFAKEILFEACGQCRFVRVENYLFKLEQIFFDLAEFYLPSKINKGDAMLAYALLTPLLYEISSKCIFIKESSSENDALLTVLEYMSEHYSEDLTLESVSSRVGIHPVSLSRLFGAHTSISFTKYINYLRATAAANLMSNTGMTFTEIAYAVGFGSVRNFNRVFYGIYKITPSEYRAAYKNS